MNEKYFLDTIGQIYDLVENAKSSSFNKAMCLVERDTILNLLDDLNDRLPAELKQARMMLENNDSIVTAAKHKAELMLKEAAEQQRKMIADHEVYREAKACANEMVRSAQAKASEVNEAAISFMDDALKATEEAINSSLGTVRDLRNNFRSIRGGSSNNNRPSPIIEDI